MKRLVIELKDDAMYKEVRIKALCEDKTIRDYVIDLIKRDLEAKKEQTQ